MNTFRILVVEDKEIHRQSATETLKGHELTIVKSFDEAMELMEVKVDRAKEKQILTEAGFPVAPKYENDQQWQKWMQVSSKANKESLIPFPFEVVLTDMMLPMCKQLLVREVFNPDEQVPYGFVIALRATLCGAQFVAMLTDTNHHKAAISASLDCIGKPYYPELSSGKGFKPNFVINGAKAMFVHTPFVNDNYEEGRKDWGRVLADLTA